MNVTAEQVSFFYSTTLPYTSQNAASWTAAATVQFIIVLFLMIFGTIGNVLVIVTICKESKLRIPGNFFIINLTVSDLIITAFSLPVISYNLVREQRGQPIATLAVEIEMTGFCQTTAYLKIIALHVSWYSLAFIALNRYYSICRNREYATYFTKDRILVTIGLIWLWVILINIPIMVGWAIPSREGLPENSTQGYYYAYKRHRPPVIYDHSSHDCVLGVNNEGGYTYANGLFVLSIPLVAIIFCYASVYMEIVRTNRRMREKLDPAKIRKRLQKERKISFMLAVVVVVFILCWTPAIIYDNTHVIDNTASMDVARLVFSWLALSNSAMNPGLYAILSKAFRIGYKKVLLAVLSKILCGSCKTTAEKSLQVMSTSTNSRTGTTTLRKISPKRLFGQKSDANRRKSELVLQGNSQMDSDFSALDVKALQNQKSSKNNTEPSAARLTVPVETYKTRYSSHYEGSDDESSDTSENRGNEKKHTVKHENKSSPVTLPKKKPLIDQLDDTNSRYTPSGIYLGGSTTSLADSEKESDSEENVEMKVNKKSTSQHNGNSHDEHIGPHGIKLERGITGDSSDRDLTSTAQNNTNNDKFLLEKLDDTNSMYTTSGIYLGGSVPKTPQ